MPIVRGAFHGPHGRASRRACVAQRRWHPPVGADASLRAASPGCVQSRTLWGPTAHLRQDSLGLAVFPGPGTGNLLAAVGSGDGCAALWLCASVDAALPHDQIFFVGEAPRGCRASPPPPRSVQTQSSASLRGPSMPSLTSSRRPPIATSRSSSSAYMRKCSGCCVAVGCSWTTTQITTQTAAASIKNSSSAKLRAAAARHLRLLDDPVLASCYAHALRVPQQRLSMATPRPGSKPVSKSRRCAKFGGFDLHAAVTVSPDDRYALERLCRVLCRPALSHERLELLDDAHVGLELKTPFSDGTSHLALSFDELLQRLCALVPRPGTHRVHYHGILAPAARHRSKVVPEPDVEPCPELAEPDDTALLGFDDDSPLKKRSKTVRKLLWAELLQRVFDVDVLKCPSCGGPSAGDRDHSRGQSGQSDLGCSRARERSARCAAITWPAGLRNGRARRGADLSSPTN